MIPAPKISHNFPEVQRAMQSLQKGQRGAMREALNRTADWAETAVRREMPRVFDRPTPYTMRSLRVFYANTANLAATLWFKQRTHDADELWALPQIAGGGRSLKPMEMRLRRAGLLPVGWMVVPGEAAPLDGYGNVSRGEISRILNVLGTFSEAGYNKANKATRERLRKGTRSSYGFAYWVNPVGGRNSHVPPGIYRRVYTAWGQSLKPMLIFIDGARYRARLDFACIVQRVASQRFSAEFDKAMDSLLRTGSASAFRRRA